MRLALLAVLAGCSASPGGGHGGGGGESGDTADDPPAYVPDCLAADDHVWFEAAFEAGEFGALEDGIDAPVGIPPQGGAPYTPFAIRVTGTGDIHLGQHVAGRATRDGVEIGSIDLDARPICSNVEPNTGWWLTYGVHIRYWDLLVADLVGSTVDFSFDVSSDPESPPYAGWGFEGVLVPE